MTTMGRPVSSSTPLWEVWFSCGGREGCRKIWAPDERWAGRILRENASYYGLQHETVLVRRVERLYVRPEGRFTPDERQAA
jgi:hypothetical protein